MSSPGPHVLILSPGSKVALTRALAGAVATRDGRLVAWEHDALSPAASFCAERVDGGPIEDAAAADGLLAWCRHAGIRLVVPTRHGDLLTLARAKETFEAAGIALAVSAVETIALCVDKVATHAWLQDRGFPVPEQMSVAACTGMPGPAFFPRIAKHPHGSGSRQLLVCRTAADLETLPRDWIVQSVAPGSEFTVNTYATREGRCVCEIPHERLLVSEGEVVRGRTARLSPLMEIARRITESLPGARGPLNIQIFWDATARSATVIEINPRFGGGYPLAHEAGGRFVDWLLQEYIDGRSPPRCDAWDDRLAMVRFREAVFFRDAP